MKYQKKKYYFGNTLAKILIGILTVLIVSLLGIVLLNQWNVHLYYEGDDTIHAQYGIPFQDTSVKAEYTGTLLKFFKIPVDVNVDTRNVNVNAFGTYTVTYTASYKNYTSKLTRKVIVEDTMGPDLQLVSSPDAYTPYGKPYTEEGFKAIDNYDGDISDKVTSKEVNGMVYYTVTDSNGNTTNAKRHLTYDDREGPVITLEGGENVIVYNGETYTDTFTAVDDVDGDITSKVKVEGSVDTNTNGTYTLQYSISDAHNNKTTATRTVTVMDKPKDGPEDEKTIYLTFDDGPYKYTDTLLDILNKYNVKATFFTTSAHPEYAYCMKEAVESGHTVAVHTASHDYAKVYASASAYWADFDQQNALIEQQTGHKSTMFRFPGGSSNTVSKNYCAGVVTQIANEAKAKGYVYFDWNVSSGDAGGTTSTDEVFENVTKQVSANTKYGKPSVVLQHDIKEFSVNAVERIINWGLENGYKFKALTPTSYTAHHQIGN